MESVDLNGDEKRKNRIAGMLYLAFGWISAVFSVVKYPYIFGAAAVMLGILAGKNGGRAGMFLIMASMAFMAVGLMLGDAVCDYVKVVAGI